MSPDRLAMGIVGVIVLLRLVELPWAEANARRLRGHGALEFDERHYYVIVALHAAYLVSLVAEADWAPWAGRHALTWPFLGLLLVALALRAWVLLTLGRRWTTRVLVVPGETPIRGGPFRFFRHPNYAAVLLEVALLPAAFGLWATLAVFLPSHIWAILRRIRSEETAWRRVAARPLGTQRT